MIGEKQLRFQLVSLLNDYYYARTKAKIWGSDKDLEILDANISWIIELAKKS